MLATLLLYAICATPFLMLIVIGFAVAGAVKRGDYERGPLGAERPRSPRPAVAAGIVVGPMLGIVLTHATRLGISPAAIAGLAIVTLIIGFVVYRAAAQRRLSKPEQTD